MIRVIVEMWPGGDRKRKRQLASFDVYNDGQHPEHPAKGNYVGRFYGREEQVLQRDCRVENWSRLKRPVLSLIRAVLRKAGY